jgi:hypothetical protein
VNLAGGVLLGDAKAHPGRGLQILVPRGYEDAEVIGKCLVPGCGARFYAGQESQWQAHVGPCARRNMDRIEAVRPPSLPIFEDFDPEVSAHLRNVGRRMLREGRLEVRKNEGAGHS